MTSLLDLPSELRAQILSYVVHYVAEAPTEAEIEQLVRNYRESQPQRLSDGRPQRCSKQHAYWIRTVLQHSTLRDIVSVYLVNKQIYREARALSETTQTLEHHLDLVVYKKANFIIPTWTYISAPFDDVNVNVLTCNVRLHGTFPDPRENSSFTTPEKGGWPSLVWLFYRIILEYVKDGPRFKNSSDPFGPTIGCTNQCLGRHLIKDLIVNIQSPVFNDGEQWWTEPGFPTIRPRVPFRMRQRLHPERLLWFLITHMQLLTGGDAEHSRYGELVFMHIGRIEFRLDGVIKKVVDPSARLDAFLNEDWPSSWPTVHGVYTSEGRRYFARQTWVPRVKRLRADYGFTPQPRTNRAERSDREQDVRRKRYSYWKSWHESLQSAKIPPEYVPDTRAGLIRFED